MAEKADSPVQATSDGPASSPTTDQATSPGGQPSASDAVAPAPAISNGTSPATPSEPNGMVQVESARLEQLERYGQQVKGYGPILQKAASLGYGDADSLGAVLDQVATFKENGVDLGQLVSSFVKPAENGAAGEPSEPISADDLVTTVMDRLRTESASTSHSEAMTAEHTFLDGITANMSSGVESDDFKWICTALVSQAAFEVAGVYPDGHAMQGQTMPHSRETSDQVAQLARSKLATLQGVNLAALAIAPTQPGLPNQHLTGSTTAGSSPLAGPTAPPGQETHIHPSKLPREERIAEMTRRMELSNARAGAAPINQAV